MKKLDEWLIELATVVSHKWQRLTGLTNFWLARVASALFVLMVAYLIVDTLRSMDGKNAPIMTMAAMCYVSMLLTSLMRFQAMSRRFREMEEHYFSGADTAHWWTLYWRESTRNVRVFSLVLLTILMACLLKVSGPSLTFWIMLTGVSGTLASFYLAIVIPLPPGKSKVRKLLDDWSLFWMPSPVPQGI